MNPSNPKYSLPSLLAIFCAIGSFMVGAFAGFLLAMCAMVLGIGGLLLAFLPSRRGGIVSSMAVLAGIVGIAAAVVKGVAWLA
jgi:hypothetical protein